MTESALATVGKIAVVGAGVMGEAIIATLIKMGYPKRSLCFVEKRDERALEIEEKFGVSRAEIKSAALSDLIFLVTKPQDLEAVVRELAPALGQSTLLVSLAAGKRTSLIEALLKDQNPVIRVMPNTPLLVGEGISAISGGRFATERHLALVTAILDSAGSTVSVAEELQDAVTAMSGSGPAYFFLFVEAMIEAGVKLGLDENDARVLAISTIKGAAKMLESSGKSPSRLREEVTSPKGTTAAALALFDEAGLKQIVREAMTAARDRSVELG